MALKRKIDKETYDKLKDDIKALYGEKDGAYVLDVEGGEDDAAELKRAKDREVQARKDAEKRVKELEEKLEEVSGVDAKKRGDIETLEKSWKEKLEKATNTANETIEKLKGVIKKTLVDGTADSLATKISTVPSLMSKSLRERMTVDFDGNEPALRILDAQGKPSALTVDDLQKEFVANKEFSSIIIGSKASGSGASKDKQQGSGGAPLGADGKPKSFREMNVTEKADYLKQQKAEQAEKEGS